METKSQKVTADCAALLRARQPFIVIVTREEARVERYLIEAANAAGYIPRTWDVAQGVADMTGKVQTGIGDPDPNAMFDYIKRQANEGNERALWIMRDVTPFLQGPAFAPTVRALRNLARLLPGVEPKKSQAIIILSPTGELPAELQGHATVIEWPLPDREEIGQLLDEVIEQYEGKIEKLNGTRDTVVDAAVGLSEEEALSCYSKSIVQYRKLDPVAIGQEKKRIITRERVLEWYDPLPGGLGAVGGLENVKAWLSSRTTAYSTEARDYGLPMPKGLFLVGVQGCGKTMLCKSVSTFWGVPLLRYDVNAMKSKFVGDSEQNFRKAYRVIDAIGRCVVWVDEIDKVFSDSGGASADGGVSADALGSFLTWMQEKQGQSFVIVTANDVTKLPPELLRKGRFDELFFVDLPNEVERVAVLEATLRTFKRNAQLIDTKAVADACDKFTGSEIASVVSDAMFVAFSDGKREIKTADLLQVAAQIVPLSETSKTKIEDLQKWAKGRARPASAAIALEPVAKKKAARMVDLANG